MLVNNNMHDGNYETVGGECDGTCATCTGNANRNNDNRCPAPQHDEVIASMLNQVCDSSKWRIFGKDRSIAETDLRHIRVAYSLVSCHDIAAIWVAFFSRCQRSLLTGRYLLDLLHPERRRDSGRDPVHSDCLCQLRRRPDSHAQRLYDERAVPCEVRIDGLLGPHRHLRD